MGKAIMEETMESSLDLWIFEYFNQKYPDEMESLILAHKKRFPEWWKD